MAIFKASTASVEVREASPQRDDDDSATESSAFVLKATPLPRMQLAAIYGIKLIVPVANTQVLPYINKMVGLMNLPGGRSVGYYTGLLSTAHTAGQILTIFFWGRLSGTKCFHNARDSRCLLSIRQYRSHACYWHRYDRIGPFDSYIRDVDNIPSSFSH